MHLDPCHHPVHHSPEKFHEKILTSSSSTPITTPPEEIFPPWKTSSTSVQTTCRRKKQRSETMENSEHQLALPLSMSLSNAESCCRQVENQPVATMSTVEGNALEVMGLVIIDNESSTNSKSDSPQNVGLHTRHGLQESSESSCGEVSKKKKKKSSKRRAAPAAHDNDDDICFLNTTRLSSINDGEASRTELSSESIERNMDAGRIRKICVGSKSPCSLPFETSKTRITLSWSKSNFQVFPPVKSLRAYYTTTTSSFSSWWSSSSRKSSSTSSLSPATHRSPSLLLAFGLVLCWMSLSTSVVFAKIQQDHKERKYKNYIFYSSFSLCFKHTKVQQ